jgi:multiple antibiotic resistance protein
MIGPAEIFTLLFVTLGPLKLLGPFAQRTHDIDESQTRQIALRASAIAAVSVVLGGLLGRATLQRWHVEVPAMSLAGGIIFFLVALKQLLEHYEPPRNTTPVPLPPTTGAAALKLVFPTVLTPYGIAMVIVLLSLSHSTERTLTIVGLLILVMLLNMLAMLFARRILRGYTVIVLELLGAILGVLQVALSIDFILEGLRGLGVIGGALLS